MPGAAWPLRAFSQPLQTASPSAGAGPEVLYDSNFKLIGTVGLAFRAARALRG
jgi:hypothetical protein